MGRRDHHQDKKARTLARDFREARPNTWRQGTGSEREAPPLQDGQPDARLTNAAFEAYYKARASCCHTPLRTPRARCAAAAQRLAGG